MNGIDSAKRKRAAALMAEGKHTGNAIAAAVQVRPETLSRWKADKTFQALVRAELDRKARGAIEERLQALAPDALDALARTLRERDPFGHATPGAIAAAAAILNATLQKPPRTLTHEPPQETTLPNLQTNLAPEL